MSEDQLEGRRGTVPTGPLKDGRSEMPTLAELEKERKIDQKTVDGPYADRHLGRPLHKEYYSRDLDIERLRRKSRWLRLPVIGRFLSLFQ